MIYHIYWGTSGNSGLYLHEIYQVLKKHGFEQRAFVNYYFPFDYGDKIFFKRGDIAYGSAKGKVRKVFQLLEVLKGYIVILLCSLKDRPLIINYSHVGQSYFFIPFYLKILKVVSGSKLMITCHDVAPHSGGSSEMKYRKEIFHLANILLVHNKNSHKELVKLFGVDANCIVEHLFPIMDLSLLSNDKGQNPFTKTDFLFIGHLSKNKGIEFLLDTWPKAHEAIPTAKLRVCGDNPSNLNFDRSLLESCNVELNIQFVSDEDYPNYIKSARYVIMPYLQGTNSGILSTVLSLGADIITSDIPMYAENPLVSKDDMFKCADAQSLRDKLVEKYNKTTNTSSDKLNSYRKSFEEGVVTVYNNLIKTSK